MPLTRREFVSATLEFAAMLAAARAWAHSFRELDAAGTCAFYDSRFPRSLAAAQAAFGPCRFQPIGGDVTDLAITLVTRARPGKFAMQGVTTDSVPFCLEQALRTPAAARLHAERLDRDLFMWRLQVHIR